MLLHNYFIISMFDSNVDKYIEDILSQKVDWNTQIEASQTSNTSFLLNMSFIKKKVLLYLRKTKMQWRCLVQTSLITYSLRFSQEKVYKQMLKVHNLYDF